MVYAYSNNHNIVALSSIQITQQQRQQQQQKSQQLYGRYHSNDDNHYESTNTITSSCSKDNNGEDMILLSSLRSSIPKTITSILLPLFFILLPMTTITTSTTVAYAADTGSDVTTTMNKKKTITRCGINNEQRLATNDYNKNYNNQCLSTANVKQIDLYVSPWTYDPEIVSNDEVIARLKGAIIEIDSKYNSIVESSYQNNDNNNKDYYIKAIVKRNLVVNDEIELIIDPIDNAVRYKIQQIDGPETLINTLKEQRQLLELIRSRVKGLELMGSNVDSADSALLIKPEGIIGELSSFFGLQSGSGYEDTLLE